MAQLAEKAIGRALMTFVAAKAFQKTGYFSQGAFNLPDPDHKIRNYLDSCNQVYQRSSTHIPEFTSHEGCGHRGIDMKLPHGLGTLLYGGMSDGICGTQGDRIFLKMESHGCRISTLKQADRDASGPADRKKSFFRDLLQSIKHGFGGLKTLLGLQKTKGTRKERMDKQVGKAYQDLVDKARDQGRGELVKILEKNSPQKTNTAYGVKSMVQNLDNAMEHCLQDEESMDFEDQEWMGAIQAFKQDLENRWDHIEHRIGNEIVMDAKELGRGDSAGEMNKRILAGQSRHLVGQLAALGKGNKTRLDGDMRQALRSTVDAISSSLAHKTDGDAMAAKQAACNRAVQGLNAQEQDQLALALQLDGVEDTLNTSPGLWDTLNLALEGRGE